jgi:uncharacterized protein with HEPN domain
MNFIVLGENVNKLSNTLKERTKQIDWNKVYGLRNIIAHHYFGINVDMVWQIIKNNLPLLKIQLKELTNNED